MSDFVKYLGSTAGALTVGAVTATAATAWYMMSRPQPLQLDFDLNCQTFEAPPSMGEPGVRISALCKDGELMEQIFDDVTTFYEAFQRGARVSGNGGCLGWRNPDGGPYHWLSYQEVLDRAVHIGAGFINKGLQPVNSTRIGMYSQNRAEYTISELACATYSMVIVPLYDTLGPNACTYIIKQSEIELVMCDKMVKVKQLLEHKKDTPQLRCIVCVETPSEDDVKFAQDNGVELVTYDHILKLGQENPVKPKPASGEDLCVICYTSGTTGNPKGAMITHKSLTSVTSALQIQLGFLNLTNDDILVSYLPLAHMYERVCETLMYQNGVRIGFYRGDVRKLMDDIAELKPTLFPTVPRLLNRMYDKVMGTVNASKVKRMLFDMAMSSKLKEVKQGIIRNDTIWDKLVFGKVQQSLGGRCRFIVSGSAPLSPRVLNFVRCAAGCTVLEGYGQTEDTAVASLQLQGEGDTGHVGVPLMCNMMKMVDVPEMDYYSKNNQGEICIKGPNVFSGYLKMPEKTEEVLDKDGWLHTGDIGMWLPNGALRVIDRKKNIFKLAQGEYIAPEKIENVYIRSPAIAQMFVHGDSLKACIVGIAVPDPETFQKWVANKLNVEGSTASLCSQQIVKEAVMADLTEIGKNAGLHSFEQVKDIYLFPELFSVENGLLTPTFKAKRHEVQKRFAEQIDNMYRKLA